MNNIEFIKQKVSELLSIIAELENRLPGRRFTLDGHLFGSIGEAIAEEYYNIELAPTGTKTHDGIKEGKNVQINGPCDWLKNCKRTKYGWYTRSLISLYAENKKIIDDDRLTANVEVRKWNRTIRN